jgi:hypothetical protein
MTAWDTPLWCVQVPIIPTYAKVRAESELPMLVRHAVPVHLMALSHAYPFSSVLLVRYRVFKLLPYKNSPSL